MRMKMIKACLILLLLCGCQTALQIQKPTTNTDFQKISKTTEQRKIAFAGGLFDLSRGELYAVYPYWHWSVPNVNVGLYICNPTLEHRLSRSQAFWNEDDNIFGDWPEETGTKVEKALSELGYNIKQHRRSYFADQINKPRADLLLSMRVIDIKFNMCYVHSPLLWRSMNRSGGNGLITVEWEVFDAVREKVLGSFTTQGYGQIDEPLQAGDKALFLSAAHNAAENLGKSDWFKKIMTTMDPLDLIPKTSHAPLILKTREKESFQPFRNRFAFARKAIITVRSEYDKQGSGFFINNEGYALTTAAIVGDAENVQIMDSSGTKYVAKVIRTDERRDVALIKADIKDNFALPISKAKETDLVEDVFAVGTPFSNSYRATIVKGIISAMRYHVHQGNRFIQADVPTAPGFSGGPLTDEYGNVIGLSQTIPDTASETNFSLFIPIKDALKALNITIEEESFK